MASDTSLEAAAARLNRVADVLKGDWTDAGHKVGKMAKEQARAVGREVTGSGRVRNMGRRGTFLNSGYDLAERGTRITLNLRPYGAWVIMEQGAKGHAIKPKRGTRTAFGGAFISAGRPSIYAPGYEHPISRPVSHPGMRQKRGAIRKTFARVRDRASETFHDEMVRKIGDIYG